MSLVLVNNGEKIALEYLVNKNNSPEDLELMLYSAPTGAITETDVLSTFTEVASEQGYLRKSLSGALWTISTSDPSVAIYPEQTFTFNGALTIPEVYGYCIVRATTQDIVWAERFTNAPFSITEAGQAISITPRIELE